MKILKLVVFSSLLLSGNASAAERRLAKRVDHESSGRVSAIIRTAARVATALSAVVFPAAGQSSVGRCFLDGTYAGELVPLSALPANVSIYPLVTANQSTLAHTEPVWQVNDGGTDDCHYSIPQELSAPVGRDAIATVNLINQSIMQIVNWMILSQPHVQTAAPTAIPTAAPTRLPTAVPSFAPTALPTWLPTSLAPTAASAICQLSCEDGDEKAGMATGTAIGLGVCFFSVGAIVGFMLDHVVFASEPAVAPASGDGRRHANPVYTGAPPALPPRAGTVAYPI